MNFDFSYLDIAFKNGKKMDTVKAINEFKKNKK